MGTYVQGVYLPGIGETGWGEEVNDALAQLASLSVNVKAAPYGAIGDGLADDTAAIQAAIDAAQLIKGPAIAGRNYMGATVYFPSGVYLISSPLVVTPGVAGQNFGAINLIGAGFQATWIKWKTGVAAPTSMIRMSLAGSGGANNGGLWRGFQLHGNSIAPRGIWTTDISEMIFESIAFTSFGAGSGNDAQLYMDGVASGCLLNTIRSCRFNGGANKGLYLHSSHGNTVISNEFAYTPGGSVKTNGGDANYFAFNDFEGLTVDGTYSLEINTSRTTIAHNRFEDITASRPAARCIYVTGGTSNVTIMGNDFNEVGSGGAPAYAIELGNACSEVLIMGNMYTNPSGVCNVKVGNTCSGIQVFNELNASAPSGHVEDNTVAPGSVVQGFNKTFPYGFDRLSVNSASIPTQGAILMKERASDASAPTTDEGQLYLKDNGAGKTQLCIRFNTGAVQVIATQP